MNAMVRERVEHLRVAPQSSEAEQSVLGAVMVFPEALNLIMLEEEDFFRRDHRVIFNAICELASAGKPYDAVTVGEWLESKGRSEQAGGNGYLVEISSYGWSKANVSAYADIIRSKAIARRVIEIATHAINRAFTEDGLSVSDEAISSLMSLAKNEAKSELTLKEAMVHAYAELTEAYNNPGVLRGVTSGLSKIDERLGGFHKGDLIVFGARPSMGKTALMLNMAQAAAKKGHCVGVISGEQPAIQVAQRHMSMQSMIPAESLRNGSIEDEQWPKLSVAIETLAKGSYKIYDRSNPTLSEVERITRKWVQLHGLSILYVDYAQRIRVPSAPNRTEEVAAVARGLKNLARDCNIPVVSLAQVVKTVDTREDKRPTMGDLANSDELTREADIITMLYRDEVYDEDSSQKGIAELNVEKNRHGPTGLVKVAFLCKSMKFADLDDR